MGKKQRGNRVLSGTHAEYWWDGDKIFEMKKFTAKVTANREDIQHGLDIDSKITGLAGEWSATIDKVYSRFGEFLKAWQAGHDLRSQFICKLGDPDAVGGQQERWSIENAWFDELPIISDWEMGGKIEEEISGGFTPTDMKNLDAIKDI